MDDIQETNSSNSTENNQVKEREVMDDSPIMKRFIENSKIKEEVNIKPEKPEAYEKLPLYSVEHAGQALEWVEEVTKMMLTYQEKCRNAVKSIQSDPHYTPDGRIEDIKVVNRMKGEKEKLYKDQAMKAVGRVINFLDEREDKIKTESAIQPKSKVEWEEANSRAVFILEDIQNWAKDDINKILHQFAYFKSTGDRVGMYLVGRYGLQTLERINAKQTANKLQKAIREATSIDNQALDEISKMRNRASHLEYWVRSQTTSEEDDRIKMRYGIK